MRCRGGLSWNERQCGNGSRREKAVSPTRIFVLFQYRYSTRWTHREERNFPTKHGRQRNMDSMARFPSLLSFLISVARRRSISAAVQSCDFYPSADSSLQQEILNKSLPITTWTERTAAASGIGHRDYVVMRLTGPIKNKWRSCFVLFYRICKWDTALYRVGESSVQLARQIPLCWVQLQNSPQWVHIAVYY